MQMSFFPEYSGAFTAPASDTLPTANKTFV